MSAQSINVQDFINSHKFSGVQWLIAILCFFVVTVDGYDIGAAGFVAPLIAEEWGIPRPELGAMLSAVLIGYAFGALIAGPLGDHFGRKSVLVGAVAWFGVLSVASAYAGSLEVLTVLRFMIGIGLGAAIPNASTLVSEFSPTARHSFIVNTMFCGFTFGSAMGGFFAAYLIPNFGWRSVLLTGGVLPLVLVPLLIAYLPESARFLVVRGKPSAKIAAVLNRIGPGEAPLTAQYIVPEQVKAKNAVSLIFSEGMAFGTVMIQATFFLGLLIVYLLTNWLPTFIRDTGMPIETAAIVTAMFQLGGTVGAILMGLVMDRVRAHLLVAASYFLGAVFVYSVVWTAGDLYALAFSVFGAGFCVSGAQTSMLPLTARFYPTQSRATGVAWMYGIGRFGGIFGALIGGQLLGAGLGISGIFSLLGIPAICAAIAVLAKERYYGKDHA